MRPNIRQHPLLSRYPGSEYYAVYVGFCVCAHGESSGYLLLLLLLLGLWTLADCLEPWGVLARIIMCVKENVQHFRTLETFSKLYMNVDVL